ncbi:MAG TPA: carbohydrate binding domain-containing protein [Pyrinomonadaceae bacterium]
MEQLKLINVGAPLRRVLLIVPVLLALSASWYASRWYVGNTMAEFAPRLENGGLDSARSALRLAPNDPWTHWTYASLEKSSFDPAALQDAVREYEEAARLSPNDYRFWMDLGRAREQAGDSSGGEKALRRAVALAPAYAYPRWLLGNLLLRSGRGNEAFDELRRAAEADPKLRPQIFNVAWYVFGEDVQAVKTAVGNSPSARAEFAAYLGGRGRFDDALPLWASLSAAEKREQRTNGEALMNALIAARRFGSAQDILRDIAPEAVAAALSREQFTNGGFESDMGTGGAGLFGWQVTSIPQAQVAIDPSYRHSGQRSLRILFKSPSTLDFKNVSQVVVVEPGAQYRFTCFVRTEDLKSAGTPLIEILDSADERTVLGASAPLAVGKSDWQQLTIDFKSPASSEAVKVRINRAACVGDPVCPIYGIVWYDDFNIQRLGGNSAPRGSGNNSSRAAAQR